MTYDSSSVSVSVGGVQLEPVEDVAIIAPEFDVSFTLTAEAAARVPDVPLGSPLSLGVTDDGRDILKDRKTVLAAREPRENGAVFFGLNYVA